MLYSASRLPGRRLVFTFHRKLANLRLYQVSDKCKTRVVPGSPLFAGFDWRSAYDRTATYSWGQRTSATSAYGGSAYHAEGSGTTTATGAYGGSATHYAGEGTVGTTSSGSTVYASDHYYGTTAAVYHPPVVINSYSTGCYNCGGWLTAGAVVAGAAVGVAVGAAVASANNQRCSLQRVCRWCRDGGGSCFGEQHRCD